MRSDRGISEERLGGMIMVGSEKIEARDTSDHSVQQNSGQSGRSDVGQKIRERCFMCFGVMDQRSSKEVENCEIMKCALWPFRSGRAKKGSGSKLKAIRKYCLYCMCGSSALVTECDGNEGTVKCPLWEYRFGKNPKLAGKRRGVNNKGLEALKKYREEKKGDMDAVR